MPLLAYALSDILLAIRRCCFYPFMPNQPSTATQVNTDLATPVSAQSLVDSIVRRLESAILSGELPPGSKISELRLAKAFCVSRGPLREAIRRLEGRQLIYRTPNLGSRVASLSKRDLFDILALREALEGMACRLAVERMTDVEISQLFNLLDKHSHQEELQKGVGYNQEPQDFDIHFRIAKGSKNKRLLEFLCGDLYYLLKVYRYHSSTIPGRAHKSYEEHRAIVQAIAERNADDAEKLMREHIRTALDNITTSSHF
jgi:DNA-binding GntR family transcriptional regulator